jgi:hypothetical protein
MTELPARITGLEEGFSVDLSRVEGEKEVLVVAATNADGDSIEIALGLAMATALWGRIREWTYEAVGQVPPTDRP